MEKIWLTVIAASIFGIITFLIWKITTGYRNKEYSKKMWELARIYYWQSVIFSSTVLTVLILFLLKSTNILSF